ncbi:MAG: hypothetical protein PHQ98_02270 [Candidatus ainarchaeum sp.]|nr:hypothetical protein [Candidatus ainarchaeum sp.]
MPYKARSNNKVNKEEIDLFVLTKQTLFEIFDFMIKLRSEINLNWTGFE